MQVSGRTSLAAAVGAVAIALPAVVLLGGAASGARAQEPTTTTTIEAAPPPPPWVNADGSVDMEALAEAEVVILSTDDDDVPNEGTASVGPAFPGLPPTPPAG